MISRKIDEILHNIQATCAKIGRDPREVVLVAVTKYTDIESVQAAIDAGIVDIGENRVQDAKQKFVPLQEQGIVFKRHMIGHLQTNKVKDAVQLFDMIQSVDSVKIAREIDKQAAKMNKVMNVLVQVNSSQEKQKSGVDPSGLLDLIDEISRLDNINIQGLMTVGLLTDNQAKIAECFHLTKSLFDQANKNFSGRSRVEMKYLSMGMTHDYQIALQCGSNMVRIGSGIFV